MCLAVESSRGLHAALIRVLTVREATMVFHLYWDLLPAKELAEMYGVSTARIYGIIGKAFKKMRHPRGMHHITKTASPDRLMRCHFDNWMLPRHAWYMP